MNIKRINKIKNHLIFADFTWNSSLSDFAKYNLIYGWNGSGKTTLSNLFRCLEKRSPVTTGEFHLQIDERSVSSTTFPTDGSLPQVRVFNRAFIEENVFTISGSINPIYFLGEDSIEKQKRIQELNEKVNIKNTEFSNAIGKKNANEKDADQFAIACGRTIKELLSSSGSNPYNNYDKAYYKRKADEFLKLPDLSTKKITEGEKEQLKKQKESIAKPIISKVTQSLPNLTTLLSEVNTILQKTVVSAVLDKLKNDHELSEWVKSGLALHKKDNKDKCLFCGNELPQDLIKKYEGHFNDQFTQFISEIDLLISILDTQIKELSSLSFPNKAEFYEHLIQDYIKQEKETKDNIDLVIKYLQLLKSKIEDKKASPFESLDLIDENPPEFTDIFESINTIISKHKTETDNHNSTVLNARKKLEEAMVAETIIDYKNKKESIVSSSATVNSIKEEIEKLNKEIKELEKEIVEHRRPADELNNDLLNYLGHSELKFEVLETGYQITRNGIPATGLSEGEKTAIAFLYFLKSLHDKDFDIANGIIIIDDPISSLDANSLFCAFGFMKERVKDAGQLFILTHNFAFFRQIKNWYHHIRPKNLTRFYMIETSYLGTNRTANILPLDKLLHQYDSEYHYLFKLVYTCANASSEGRSLEAYYHLPNVARRLLESFISFKHPKIPGGELYNQIKEIPFDETKKSRILRFLHTHSHHGHIDDPEHDMSILSETPQILMDVLKLIEENDKHHHDELVELVTESLAESTL